MTAADYAPDEEDSDGRKQPIVTGAMRMSWGRFPVIPSLFFLREKGIRQCIHYGACPHSARGAA
jgi:hypothetical protein